jgi:S1-C subfamily serine protease
MTRLSQNPFDTRSARGRDVTAGGETHFGETGSGVLIAADGRVMTAAHVVHAMDQVSVEFLGARRSRRASWPPSPLPTCPSSS